MILAMNGLISYIVFYMRIVPKDSLNRLMHRYPFNLLYVSFTWNSFLLSYNSTIPQTDLIATLN